MKKLNIKILKINFGLKENVDFQPIEFEFKYCFLTTIINLYKFVLKKYLKEHMQLQYYDDIINHKHIYRDFYFVVNGYGYYTYKNIKLSKLINVFEFDSLIICASFYTGGDGHCIDHVGNMRITMHYNDHNPPHFHVISSAGNKASVEIETEEIIGNLTRKEQRMIRKYVKDEKTKNNLYENWKLNRVGIDVDMIFKVNGYQ